MKSMADKKILKNGEDIYSTPQKKKKKTPEFSNCVKIGSTITTILKAIISMNQEQHMR